MPFQRRNVLQIGNSKNRVSWIFRALQDVDRQLNHKNYALDSARSRSWDKGGGARSSRPLDERGGGGPGPSPGSATARSRFHTLYLPKTHICSFWTSCFFTFTLPHLTQRRNAYIKPRCQTRILQRSYKTWRWQLKFPIPLAQVMVKYPEFARAVLVWDRIQIVETTRLWFWSGIGYGF